MDINAPATLFDDTVDRGQAKPGAASGPLVVKNGSKIRACTAGSMPQPVSLTRTIIYEPACVSEGVRTLVSANFTLAVSIVNLPPCGMASRALITRFMMTCSIMPASTLTFPSP